jgi:prepilin-type N-terminal cleavage/methylation domain-containing protein
MRKRDVVKKASSAAVVKPGGWTFVELLVVLAILSILGAWGGESLAQWRRKAELSSAAAALRAHLEVGRYQALAARANVVFCASEDHESCLAGAGSGDGDKGLWNRGAILFVDLNHNGQRDGDGETLVGTGMELPANSWLSWRSFRKLDYMAWEQNGQAYASNGTFSLCNGEGRAEWLRQYVINRAGRVRPGVLPDDGLARQALFMAACQRKE